MYVVKVLHGYIDKEGQRTREKDPEKLWVFQSKQESDHFATKIGGRSKHISKIRKDWTYTSINGRVFFSISVLISNQSFP